MVVKIPVSGGPSREVSVEAFEGVLNTEFGALDGRITTEVSALDARTTAQEVAQADQGGRLTTAETQITALEAGQTSQQIVVSSWSDLSARVGTLDGQGAEVIDADTGSHPAASATGYDGAAVDNAGLYQWRADWSRWVRLRGTGLSGKLTAAANLGDLPDAAAARANLGAPEVGVVDTLVGQVGPAAFSLTSVQHDWLRVVHDAERNILGGFRRDGRFSADLAEDTRYPQVATARWMNGATTMALPPGSGWLRAFLDEGAQILGGWDAQGELVAALSERCVSERLLNGAASVALPDQSGWLRVTLDGAGQVICGIAADGQLVAHLSERAQGVRLLNGATSRAIPAESGWLRVFEDGAGEILGGWDASGRFVADISERARLPVPDVTEAIAAAFGGISPASGPDICCIGDSMTAGAGATSTGTHEDSGGIATPEGVPYPTALAQLTGRTVRNLGVGGETSATISARLGTNPFMATVSGGEIPSSGAVEVTLRAYDGGSVAPLLQGSAGINPCSLNGVVGSLSLSGGAYVFTRASSGLAVPVPVEAPILTDARTRWGDILVYWWGQNDGSNDATTIISRINMAIAEQTAGVKRYLVLGLPSSTEDYRAPMEAQFLAAYGRRFLNVRQLLATEAAMDEAGLTPTQADLDAIAIGRVPPSLRNDSTHFNGHGYAVLARSVRDRMLELNFITEGDA